MARKIRDRRSVLLLGLVLGAAAKIGLTDTPAFAASNGAAPMKVRVTLDGKSYEFDEAKGRDLGDYKGSGFVQRCVMVTVPDLPLSVFMRPDRDSERVEVVIELGRMWSGPPRHLGAYTVEIERGDKRLVRIEVPNHFWFSRWRWQSAPRPVRGTVKELIAAGLLPPYSEAIERPSAPASARAPAAKPQTAVPALAQTPAPAASGGAGLPQGSAVMGNLRRGPNGELIVANEPPPAAPAATAAHSAAASAPAASARTPLVRSTSREYTIMGLAGLEPGMPTTGDRDDIGPLTEPQARWVCTGESDAADSMIAQAEASGTFPWNMRDEKTGAPFNFDQYPKAGWFSDAPNMCDPYIPQLKSGMIVDSAHHPALAYVPFLATGDPYYLEALQLSTTWCIGSVVWEYRLAEKCILSHGQTRSYAWCLRDVMQLAKVTPANVPGWLLPRAYWERILENNRVWFTETFLHNSDPPWRVFRVATQLVGTTQVADKALYNIPMASTWMEEYLAFILGWTVMIGHESWRDIFSWKVGSTIARMNGRSGWQRAYATPYETFFKRTPSGPWAESWKELWDTNLQLQQWHLGDPDRWSEPSTGYLTYSRAVLGLAARLGIPEAKECYVWADQQIAGTPPDQVYRWHVRPA